MTEESSIPAAATASLSAVSTDASPGAFAVPELLARDTPGSGDDDVIADPNAGGSRWLLGLGALGLVVLSLFGQIAASGIWEPPELRVAEFARRIAVALLGAKDLVIAGANNAVPTAGEIGRGELPLTSIGLGFRVFGLREWAGRLPMALWGFLGIAAMYALLSRLVDRVTAFFAAIVLATAPLYFLQSRTMLGDIVVMAGTAIAVAGFALAVFEQRSSVRVRALWFALGVLGLLAGYGARGVILGVAVPALSVGLTWLILRGGRSPDRLSDVLGGLCLSMAVAAIVVGLHALLRVEDRTYVRLLGCTIQKHRIEPTHDALILQLGHAFFPWSAVVPFAMGRVMRRPIGVSGEAFERETAARTLVLVVSIVAFGVGSGLAPWTGVLPFTGVFALAAVTAIALRDFERGAPGSRTMALGVATLLILFCTDYKNSPQIGLSAFVVDDGKFPESFRDVSLKIIEIGSLASAALFGLFFLEREEGQATFERDEYASYWREVRSAFGGNLYFGIVTLGAGLATLSAVTIASDRFLHLKRFDRAIAPGHDIAKFAFIVLPVLVALPSLLLAMRDGARVLLRFLRVSRATAALFAIALFGAVLSFGYYPLLARQTSPKEVFESFVRLAKPGEALAMVGTSAGAGGARYYAKRDVQTFSNSGQAFTWLTERPAERRWLVVRSSDIAQLNSQFRARAPSRNLPVLDARSSEILLVSNKLLPGETNRNPFSKWIHDERPSPQHVIDADFNGQLHALGWSVTDTDGRPQQSVKAGHHYLFHLFYEVTRPIAGEWETFIHVDGYQRRYNGDHRTLEGKYPFRLWHPGDFIEDIDPIDLEPNFAGATYTVYFGLFRGDQRLEVKRGRAEENRVNAGTLDVR